MLKKEKIRIIKGKIRCWRAARSCGVKRLREFYRSPLWSASPELFTRIYSNLMSFDDKSMDCLRVSLGGSLDAVYEFFDTGIALGYLAIGDIPDDFFKYMVFKK